MTELRSTARFEAVTPQLTPPPAPRQVWRRGLAGLGLGAALTVLAVLWANGVLGLVSLLVVLGSLSWISIGLVRHYAARLRRT
jgi:hypothetical protein